MNVGSVRSSTFQVPKKSFDLGEVDRKVRGGAGITLSWVLIVLSLLSSHSAWGYVVNSTIKSMTA